MKHGRGMGEDSDKHGHTEALAMLDLFASVGATRFEVTWTTPPAKRNVPPQREPRRTRAHDAGHARSRARQQRNVIVRPHGPNMTFIQLDDLKADSSLPSPPPCFSCSKPRPAIFRHGPRCRRRRQGFCAAAAKRHRRRCDRQRRHARRRQPQFQGQIRARLSARCDPPAQPGRMATAAELERPRLRGRAGNRGAAAAHHARPSYPRRQPPMAELCPLRRRRAAQQRGNRPRLSAGPISSSA